MSDAVEKFLANYSVEVRDLALKTRALILSIMPDAVEHVNIGHKAILYSTGAKMMSEGVLFVAPLKARVNLGFFRGTELPDPNGILEGTGKLLRHVKIHSAKDLEKPGLRELMEAAVANQN